MGQARQRRLAIAAGTAAPEDLLRGSALLGKDGMLTHLHPDDAAVDAIALVLALKDPRVAEMPVSRLVPHLATSMRTTARERLADHSLKIGAAERAHTEMAAEALARFPLPPEAKGDPLCGHLDDFAEVSGLHLIWLRDVVAGELGSVTVADGTPAFAALLAELDRLAALPDDVTATHLARCIARKYGFDAASASQAMYDSRSFEREAELDPGLRKLLDEDDDFGPEPFDEDDEAPALVGDDDDDDDDDDEEGDGPSYLDSFPPDAGTVVEKAALLRHKAGDIATWMEQAPGARDFAAIGEAKEFAADAAETLAGWVMLYGGDDPEYPFEAGDAGRAALIAQGPEIEAAALRLVSAWDGADAGDVWAMLELIMQSRRLREEDDDIPVGIAERLMLGREAVLPFVLDDEPDLLFQDIDGDIAVFIDGEVVLLDYDEEAVMQGRGPFRRMEACKIARWKALLNPKLPALVAHAAANGGMEAWVGREDALFAAAAPELALLVQDSASFRDCAIDVLHSAAEDDPPPSERKALPPQRRLESGRPYSRTVGRR